MALKRKVGRPPRENTRRDKALTIRLTTDEHKYIHKKAEEAGISMTELLVTAVLFYRN